jgi:XisI protein
MDTLDTYRQIIENVLIEYTTIPYAYGDIQTEAIFDRKNDRTFSLSPGRLGNSKPRINVFQ